MRTLALPFRSLWLLILFTAAAAPLHATINDPVAIHVGVQAMGSKGQCFDQWRSTAEYLNTHLPDKDVHIVCLDYEEVEKAVYEGRVDFTITNPAIYINLEYIFGATRIATLKGQGDDEAATQYGGVLIKRADRRDIASTTDLKGKRFAAVHQLSFGGWIMAWRHLKRHGVDPQTDFARLDFLKRHENVVMAVRDGTVDAGTIGTGVLERMRAEGQIHTDEIEVIDPQPVDPASTFGIYSSQEENSPFPYVHTTELYPQWALAKVHHVPAELAARVMFAFLQLTPTSQAALASKSMGWVIPLDYFPVNKCLEELKIGPYLHLNTPITLTQLYRQYRLWVNGVIGLFVVIVSGIGYVLLLNGRLTVTMGRLATEHRMREHMVTELNEFKTTLDRTNDCVFIFDPETLLFLYINQGGLDQVGYSMEEMASMRPTDIAIEYGEEQFRALIAPLLDNTERSIEFATQHRSKQGDLVPVEVVLQHITPAAGKGRCVAVVRNISRRLAERKEREQLQTRLLNEQKLAAVGQLAAGIAHEINTPAQYVGSNIDFLGASFKEIDTFMLRYGQLVSEGREGSAEAGEVLGRLEELRTQADWDYLQEEIPKAVDQSQEGVAKIRSIVQAMKEFSHPGSREKQFIDLNRLMETTVTISRNEWKYVADIEKRLDPDLPQVFCLVNEIGQVFLNILVNGAHAIASKLGTDPEREKGRITITTRAKDDQAEIVIADTGCGIPAKITDRIFEPFFTTKEVGRGTGQGLTISYDVIVNKHGGTLDFVSTEGEGTAFIIRLPLGSPNRPA